MFFFSFLFSKLKSFFGARRNRSKMISDLNFEFRRFALKTVGLGEHTLHVKKLPEEKRHSPEQRAAACQFDAARQRSIWIGASNWCH